MNGFNVGKKDGDVIVVLDYFGYMRGIEKEEIKSIVTKEQLANIEYKLEDK